MGGSVSGEQKNIFFSAHPQCVFLFLRGIRICALPLSSARKLKPAQSRVVQASTALSGGGILEQDGHHSMGYRQLLRDRQRKRHTRPVFLMRSLCQGPGGESKRYLNPFSELPHDINTHNKQHQYYIQFINLNEMS